MSAFFGHCIFFSRLLFCPLGLVACGFLALLGAWGFGGQLRLFLLDMVFEEQKRDFLRTWCRERFLG